MEYVPAADSEESGGLTMPTLQDLLQKADCYEAVSHGSAYDFILKLARQQVWGWPVPSLRKKTS